jgi:hypothetical protein
MEERRWMAGDESGVRDYIARRTEMSKWMEVKR